MSTKHTPTDAANAHLIDAAPDLLEALQRALVALNVAFTAEEDPFGVHHNDAVDAVSMAEVAIAKATNTLKQ